MRRTRFLLILGTLLLPHPAIAGCIGPTIMGKCEGSSVPWDTHRSGYKEDRPAGPGFYWDKRSVPMAKRQHGAVDPFTGRDAHDSSWGSDGAGIPRGGYR